MTRQTRTTTHESAREFGFGARIARVPPLVLVLSCLRAALQPASAAAGHHCPHWVAWFACWLAPLLLWLLALVA